MANHKKQRILELVNFSAGICGVWARAREESSRLSKSGYEVRVFSSKATKGESKLACENDNVANIKIKRFSFKKLGGESFMSWNFKKEALKFCPDIIICHSYRHLHTLGALEIKEELKKKGRNCKVFLVTHAPFERTDSRTFLQRVIISLYDLFIGKKTINKFDKIIAITKWEIPYLKKLGVKDSKLVYIPNGIPEEFFKLKNQAREENKIFFLGRIAPIKNIEVLIKAMNLIKDKKIILDLIGPAEEAYKAKLIELVKEQKLEQRVFFHEAVYDVKEKISIIDSHKIFVLPSKSEGMPQVLIEALARGKIIIGNNIPAIRDLILEGKNGYIFNDNEKSLANKLDLITDKKNNQIQENAINSVREFNWKIIIKKIENLF